MAQLKNGILGGIKGKIINVVGYSLNGQDIIRGIGENSKPRSEKQLYSNLQMAVLMDFLSSLDTLIKTGFYPQAKGTTRNYHNLAVSYNKRHALKGSYPDVEIDYPAFKFSAGALPQPVNTTFQLTSNGLVFTWESEGYSWPENQDRAMLFAYAPATGNKKFKHSGAMRLAGEDLLEIPLSMRNQTLEVWISFVSDDRQRAADSLYLGRINS